MSTRIQPPRAWLLAVLCGLASLAGCGGGTSGGGSGGGVPVGPQPDRTPPTIVARTPADGENAPAGLDRVTVTFSEPISLRSDTAFELRSGGATGALVATTLATGEREFTLTAATALAAGQYTARVANLADASGNFFSESTWSFSVQPAPDLQAPTIVARTPADGENALPGLNRVTVTFSEPISLRSDTVFELRSGGATGTLVATTFTRTEREFTLTAATALATGDYTARVANVADESGNFFSGSTWSFGVRPPPDRTAPTVVGRSPAPDEVVRTDANVRVTFSEPPQRQPPTIELRRDAADGPVIAATLSVNAERTTYTLQPDAALPAGTTLFVSVANAVDESGNAGAATSWSFRTRGVGFELVTGDLRTSDAQGRRVQASTPSLTIDSKGNPVLLFSDGAGSQARDGRVLRIAGGFATPPGVEALPLLPRTAPVTEQVVRVDAGDAPVVAWIEEVPSNACERTTALQMRVAQLVNGAWSALGDTVNDDFCDLPQDLSFVLDAAGRPVVATGEGLPRVGIVPAVRRYANGTWAALGPGLALRTPGTSGAIATDLAVSPTTGRVTVAWTENNGGVFRTYVAEFDEDAGQWRNVGGIVAVHEGGSNAATIRLVVAADGRYFVLLRQSNELELRVYDGTAWATAAPRLTEGAAAQPRNYSLLVNGELPIVTWEDGATLGAHVARLNQSTGEWVSAPVASNVADLTDVVYDPQRRLYWIAKFTDGFRTSLRLSRAEALP